MDLKNKTIAVTGASGMIGAYICRSLMRSGATVIGVVRNPQKAEFLTEEGVVFRKADLMDVVSLEKAFEGCDAVVSNAAMFVFDNRMNAWDAHEKANTEGTRNVFDAAYAASVKRIIQISTFGIYKLSLFKTVTEESPQLDGYKRKGGAYRATKQISEVLAWELAKKYGMSLTTLRPSIVFGARDKNFLAKIYKWLSRPLVVIPSVSLPLVFAGDVADSVAAALSNDCSIDESYNVCGDSRQLADFISVLQDMLPRKPVSMMCRLPFSVKADSSKAERDLQFKSRPFRSSLREILSEECLL